MNNRPVQSALREWKQVFSSKTPYILFCAIALLCSIISPFQTAGRLSLSEAFFYWLLITGGTYSIGLFITLVLQKHLQTYPKILRYLVLGAMIGLVITPFISLLNYISFSIRPFPQNYLVFNLQVSCIAAIVCAILDLVAKSRDPIAQSPKSAALLARLPFEQRGDIMALSAQDHYTRVQTTKGDALILIRLSDAIQECAPVRGLRVHRSHWVALDHVAQARSQEGRKFLTLHSGETIPVSRSFYAAVREAGLFGK